MNKEASVYTAALYSMDDLLNLLLKLGINKLVLDTAYFGRSWNDYLDNKILKITINEQLN